MARGKSAKPLKRLKRNRDPHRIFAAIAANKYLYQIEDLQKKLAVIDAKMAVLKVSIDDIKERHAQRLKRLSEAKQVLDKKSSQIKQRLRKVTRKQEKKTGIYSATILDGVDVIAAIENPVIDTNRLVKVRRSKSGRFKEKLVRGGNLKNIIDESEQVDEQEEQQALALLKSRNKEIVVQDWQDDEKLRDRIQEAQEARDREFNAFKIKGVFEPAPPPVPVSTATNVLQVRRRPR